MKAMETSSRVQQEYQLPRIHKGLLMVDLKEEAIARGLDGNSLPNKKGKLLEHLVDGSVHLKLAFEDIRRVLESELDALRAENKRQGEHVVTRTAAAKQSQQIGLNETGSAMNEETAAKSNEKKGQKRVGGTTSMQAGPQPKKPKVLDQTVPNQELDNDMIEIVERYKKLQQKRDEGKKAALAKECPPEYKIHQFSEFVKRPPKRWTTFDSLTGFTVWYNIGEASDWRKVFDSTWKTKKQANLRATYLFYWKNCWRIHPNEMMYKSRFKRDLSNKCLLTLQVQPVDSDVWRVGVLPNEQYYRERLYFESTQRHNT